MKIKITGCSKPTFWYSGLVGRIIEATDLESDGYAVGDIRKLGCDYGGFGYVEKCDAVEVKDIKVGDIVKVISPGDCYDTYHSMFCKHNFYNLDRNTVEKGWEGIVIATDVHDFSNLGTPLFIIDFNNGKQGIMNSEGIELVEFTEEIKPRQTTISQLFEEKVKQLKTENHELHAERNTPEGGQNQQIV